MSEGVWRWNVNSVWENFSSLCQEATLAKEAVNDFRRYHHTKAALFFGVNCIESFFNQLMREHLAGQGIEEDAIRKKLRNASFKHKLEKWIEELCENPIIPEEETTRLLEWYRETRNEVTHPKNKDHSIYLDLDKVRFTDFQTTVAEYMVRIHEARKEVFPYWLFGVNFVGMNGDYRYPCLSNNMDFLGALRWMGVRGIPSPVGEANKWLQVCMGSLKGYREGVAVVKKLGCESRYIEYPAKPRLCWRWWDDQHIKNCGLPAQ